MSRDNSAVRGGKAEPTAFAAMRYLGWRGTLLVFLESGLVPFLLGLAFVVASIWLLIGTDDWRAWFGALLAITGFRSLERSERKAEAVANATELSPRLKAALHRATPPEQPQVKPWRGSGWIGGVSS